MFTKLFLTTVISTLALSAFCADTQAGRYRVEGPTSGGAGDQAGRYSLSADSVTTGATQSDWNQTGQSQVVGRYRQGEGTFEQAPASQAVPEYAQTQTQRGPAKDVSNKPATVPASK